MTHRPFCPVCKEEHQSHFLTAPDHSVSKEIFTIVQCNNCGFRFTNPVPEADIIGNYYKSESYVSHSSSNKGFINKLYLFVRRFTLKQKVRLVLRETKGLDLLDVGSGTGHFLYQAQGAGFHVMGLEPDADARKFAMDSFHVKLSSSEDLHTLPDQSRDVITMWHVLEHVYDLRTDLDKIFRILRSDGVLIVAVPNCNSYDARYYKEYWAAYDLPIHLYHFVPDDMRRLVGEYGWEVQKILPMKLDSFYVSLLSEKYKGGNIFRAFLTGLKSNWLADNEKYSSQIYIIRRKTH